MVSFFFIFSSLVVLATHDHVNAQTPTCFGKPATIINTANYVVVNGTDGDDVIVSTGRNTDIYGKGGNDTICGGPHSRIYGSTGNNIISGGGYSDIFGGGGKNIIFAKAGPGNTGTIDVAATKAGTVGVNCDPADTADDGNRIYGGGDGAATDILIGCIGHDEIRAGKNKAEIYGYGGDDLLTGGSGNNRIYGNDGNDTIYGGPITNDIHGGQGDDEIHGGGGVNTIFGDDGNDTLYGGPVNDYIDGGAGSNFIDGQGGQNTCLNADIAINCIAPTPTPTPYCKTTGRSAWHKPIPTKCPAPGLHSQR